MSCERCNGTGLTAERREGVMYYYTCSACERVDPLEYRAHELREIAARETREIPVTAVC